ncbi:erythroblast NAD(P)(+)--arginine ADP-ribosyltransferase-like [Symphorus nematophorus]
MSDDAVDDMYFGCHEEMMKTVKNKYFEEEKCKGPFEEAWNEAEECAERNLKHIGDKPLTKAHLQAICAYTGDKVYNVFNAAVRTERSSYGSSFQYHSLHFLLTSAIQILNSNYHCHTTYRRNNIDFTGEVNQIIRFGGFASSSFRTDLSWFGNKTCFKIKTCAGAFLKNYSSFGSREEEVLIPPYEMFKITQIIEGQVRIQGLTDCEVVYILESAGVKSNLNCKAVQP